MIYDKLVYMKTSVVGNVAGFECSLTLNISKLTPGKFVEIQTPTTLTQLSDVEVHYSIMSADPQWKGYSEFRAGFFKGQWITPVGAYGFPLDPK
jgi:NAD(P)H-flavin reductase